MVREGKGPPTNRHRTSPSPPRGSRPITKGKKGNLIRRGDQLRLASLRIIKKCPPECQNMTDSPPPGQGQTEDPIRKTDYYDDDDDYNKYL